MYSESDLIVNTEGRVYHLNLLPEQLANTILTVGDPARVSQVSRYFDRIEYRQQHREFVVHTGYLAKQRITVLSTGMGTDNIDIVLNELDALVNIDLVKRQPKTIHQRLNIIRIGTCGALQAETTLDSFVLTDFSIGFDNLLLFYQQQYNGVEKAIQNALCAEFTDIQPYVAEGATTLIQQFSEKATAGMTATMPGFYGPQGRSLRLPLAVPNFMQHLTAFQYQDKKILSFDMETAGIYGLGELLGHACCSIAVVVAQRHQGQFTSSVDKAVDHLIRYVLEAL
jgi:uridine phosphorylase